MSETKELLRRGGEGFAPREGIMDSLIRRRDRKRRNKRIAAGVVGIAVFVAAVWITTSGLSFDRTQTPVARPAAAVDDGFRGWYQIIARGAGCPVEGYTRRTRVHHAEMELQFGPYARYVNNDFAAARTFRYVSGKYYPWQHTRGSRFVLRYDPSTDTAVGIRGPLPQGCTWHVRLVPIGPPAKG